MINLTLSSQLCLHIVKACNTLFPVELSFQLADLVSVIQTLVPKRKGTKHMEHARNGAILFNNCTDILGCNFKSPYFGAIHLNVIVTKVSTILCAKAALLCRKKCCKSGILQHKTMMIYYHSRFF